jgi:hypothetical protein
MKNDLCLHLEVWNFRCACGNQWKHSYPILAGPEGPRGGTPTPEEEWKLKYESMSEHNDLVNGCHRCVPLQMGKGWIDNKNLELKEIHNKHLEEMGVSTDQLLS